VSRPPGRPECCCRCAISGGEPRPTGTNGQGGVGSGTEPARRHASLGVHKIDTMHYLVRPIARVSTFTRPGRKDPIDKATVLALEFESGALATLTTDLHRTVLAGRPILSIVLGMLLLDQS